jgi:L-fucose mutarotase/ribose pyranase (RbsD/FucU family)
VLTGIHPLLTGPLLAHLDAMGHSDARTGETRVYGNVILRKGVVRP